MSRLENLPPDLRATLSLVLGQRRRYAEIAKLLRIEQHAVHDRAHAALALLAPRQARELSVSQREQVGEYLLGQADPGQQAAAVGLLEGSAAARAWARTLADELAPICSAPLPEIPGGEPVAPPETSGSVSVAPPETSGSVPVAPPPETPGDESVAPPETLGGESSTDEPERASSSRRGGALVLLGLAAVVVVAVALVIGLSGGGSSPSSAANSSADDTPSETSSTTSPSSSASPSTTTTGHGSGSAASGKGGGSGKGGKSATEPHLTATLPLTPPNSTSKALGLVEVIAEGSEHAFILAAEHLPPTHGFHYAAWLYNTPTDAFFLGGETTVGANGVLKAAQGLPRNASRYASIILTEEHEKHPKQPGPIVLNGSFKLE